MEKYRNIIRFDWAAKRILRDKANFVVLEGLLSVLLGGAIRIKEILESEGNAGQEDAKFNRVDIMAKNDRDELVIVEIQLSRHVHYLERILFGVGKAISEHISKGDRYGKVKKVYSISILYFDYGAGHDYVYKGQTVFRGLHSGEEFTLSEHERFKLGMRTPGEVFPEYYLIRVNEFDKVAMTPLEEWMEYLKSGQVRPGTTTPGLKEAQERLDYMLMSEPERRAYDRYLDDIRYEEDCVETAKLEGREEGREEGLAEGRAEGQEEKAKEIASRLLSIRMSPEQVMAITGLPEDKLDKPAHE